MRARLSTPHAAGRPLERYLAHPEPPGETTKNLSKNLQLPASPTKLKALATQNTAFSASFLEVRPETHVG